jgi:hypothetical protein
MNGNEESGISALSRLLAQPGTNLGRLNDAP